MYVQSLNAKWSMLSYVEDNNNNYNMKYVI